MIGPVRVTNWRGRPFNVRVVERGDRHGLDDCKVHDEDDGLVEFWDATYAGDPRFGSLGQFAARYYASTMRAHQRAHGLDLVGHVAEWKLDPAALEQALQQLGVLAPPAREVAP